jgi:hypothetical protein
MTLRHSSTPDRVQPRSSYSRGPAGPTAAEVLEANPLAVAEVIMTLFSGVSLSRKRVAPSIRISGWPGRSVHAGPPKGFVLNYPAGHFVSILVAPDRLDDLMRMPHAARGAADR